jgi:hypothetical protein
MALQQTVMTRVGVEATYIRIDSIEIGSGGTLSIGVNLYLNQEACENGARFLDWRIYGEIPYKKGANPYEVGYNYMKALEEWKEAKDA